MWPEVQYQSPLVESTRVIACFEAEQQRLVAGIEVGGAQFGMAFEIEPAGAHEAERLGDAVGQFLIAARPAASP